MAVRYRSGAHARHRFYHLVWVSRYRKRVLEGKVAIRLQNLFYEAAKVQRWWIEELKILPDHVHLLIQVQPTEPVSEVAQILKVARVEY